MSRKDRSDLRHPFFHAEKTRTAHPLVELRDGIALDRLYHEVVDGFNHGAAGIAEHDGFHIIPPAGNGFYSVVLPQFKKELIFIELLPKTHQDDFRFSGDLPPPESAWNFFYQV